MKKNSFGVILFSYVILASCGQNASTTSTSASFKKGTYGYDAGFLKAHTKNVLELSDENGGSKVLLSADYEGRVMTSTANGDTGKSFGWMNYNLIAASEKKKQFNPFGGEERFWLGPEGGQYALYFNKGDSFNISRWQVPAIIDTVAYDVAQQNKTEVTFTKNASLKNYAGTNFEIAITRKIQLLDKAALQNILQTTIPSNVQFVAFATNNEIKNTGINNWAKDSGLLSIWLLGMFTPTEETKVVIPFSPISNAKNFITDNYFGKVAADRLQENDSFLYFRCDGKSRGKIGLSPMIAKPIAGSFDFKKNVLTILIPEVNKTGDYVNSKWELQKEPYKGDVINSYNDGPLADDTQLGPFYEIESSSAVKELKPGEAQTYKQTTCHFQGDYEALKNLAKQLLGVDLDELKKW